MSRSKPTDDARNPVTRFYEWQGSTGKIKWYDKEAKEQKTVELPFSFLVLDQLNTITGFSDGRHSGLWSNEVRSTHTDQLTVRSKAGIEFQGLYSDMNVQGAKFAKSVYVAVKDKSGKLELANFKISGAALGPWIEFCKSVDVMKYGIAITGSKDGKKGANEFKIPVYNKIEVSSEADAEATELDKVIQDYLDVYLTRRPSASVAAPVEAAEAAKAEQDVQIKDLDTPDEVADSSADEAIDLNSLRF